MMHCMDESAETLARGIGARVKREGSARGWTLSPAERHVSEAHAVGTRAPARFTHAVYEPGVGRAHGTENPDA